METKTAIPQSKEPLQKVAPIQVIAEDIAPLDSSTDDGISSALGF